MYCKLCNNPELKKIEAEDKLYYHCDNCGLIFIDKNQILETEEELERYKMHDNSHQNEGYVNMFKRFITKVVTPHINDINTVLEFGCGPGPVLADLLKNEGFNVDKYDPYFFPDKVFEDKSYDMITSTEVFEHFSEPKKELELLLSHLNKGGYLAIMTSFHPGVEEFVDWYYVWDDTHITFYNLDAFKWIEDNYPLKLVYHNDQKYCLFKKT